MGQDAEAKIVFGIDFGGSDDFPWDRKFDGDIEDWWRSINNYVGLESPFDSSGNYKPGIKSYDKVVDDYFNERRQWLKDNPIPIEMVRYCSYDYPAYVMSVASETYRADWSDPAEVDPAELMKDQSENAKIILDFCEKYGIEVPSQPRWLLVAFFG